jgi:alkylhydroperoxidase family enzyme
VEGLHRNGIAPAEIAALQADLDYFPEKERTLLRVAESMTVDPSTAAARVVEAKRAGWSDAEVAEAILLAGFTNMNTRIAEAFALPPDKWHPFTNDAKLPLLRCAAEP